MTPETDALIDRYITTRQLPGSPDRCDDVFRTLLDNIVTIERGDKQNSIQTIIKDVDALFQDRNGRIVYLEVKYNDDHDTGKFVDINRKFLKTYAGLINHFPDVDPAQILPILYYFNPTKRWGPIYTPSTHIYRGAQLFDEFFTAKYSDLDACLRNIGNDEDVIALFDDMHNRVRHRQAP